MRHRIVFLLLVSVMNLPAQQPQQYVFQHIDQSDGLLHNNVLGMRQDARGYIWVRTPNGLQRYDGSRFVSYRTILDNPVTGPVSGGEIYFDSAANEIWLKGKGEMQKLSLGSNRFTTYTWQELQHISSAGAETFYSGEGVPWQFNGKELFQSPGSTENFIPLFHAGLCKPGESGASIYDSTHQIFWLAVADGLMLLDKKTHRICHAGFNPVHHPLLVGFARLKLSPRFIMMDRQGDLWISTWGDEFFRFDSRTQKLNEYSLASIKRHQSATEKISETQLVNTMFEDKAGNIWIATENAGLLRYLPEKDGFETIEVDTKNGSNLRYNYKIYCVLQDKEENLWLGTDQGISIFNPSGQFFRSVQHSVDQPSVPKAEITRVNQCVNGDLLIGTWGGGFAVYDSLWNFRQNITVPNSVDVNMVWCFVNRDDGKVFIGCQHGNLHIYNPVTRQMETSSPPEMEKSTIRCMVKDKEGNVWFGLNNGHISEWNRSRDEYYFYGNTSKQSRWMAPVLNMLIDARNMIWVATDNGFKMYDPATRILSKTYLPEAGNPESISATSIQAIAELDDTTLLLGTVFGGIEIFSTRSGKFRHLNIDKGLPSNSVFSVRKSEDGFIWFTTDYNLYKFKPGSQNFIRYNLYPGTINSAFVAAGFYPLRNGTWVTTSATDVIAFQPTADPVRSRDDMVNISGFRIADSLIFIDSFLARRKPVELSSRQNFITIQYASLNFSRLRQSRYYYRLSGVDDKWVSAGNKNFASYTNLPPGKYVFSVRAGEDSDLSPYSRLEIIIRPALWQTWWFRTLCVAALILLVWSSFRRRVRSIRYEALLNQKMMESKMVALRAQMNPHFIFNCLNSIDNLIQLNEKEKATLYLSKFARLIRSTLEHSDQPAIPCWKDMETLQLYLELESLRFDNKFSWKLNIAREIMQGDYKVPPLIIQPFVENAIHHGLLNKIDENKQLLVDVSVTGSHIRFIIEDNGVGRDRANLYKQMNASAHQSMGLQITQDRIKLFNRRENDSVVITDLLNDNMEPAGTKVNIELINLS